MQTAVRVIVSYKDPYHVWPDRLDLVYCDQLDGALVLSRFWLPETVIWLLFDGEATKYWIYAFAGRQDRVAAYVSEHPTWPILLANA